MATFLARKFFSKVLSQLILENIFAKLLNLFNFLKNKLGKNFKKEFTRKELESLYQ